MFYPHFLIEIKNKEQKLSNFEPPWGMEQSQPKSTSTNPGLNFGVFISAPELGVSQSKEAEFCIYDLRNSYPCYGQNALNLYRH
jgi:hypothetical protein